MTDCILIFVKYPNPGEVMTRLAKGCTLELAAAFYRLLVAEKLAELRLTPDADIFLCYAPETARDDMHEWLGSDCRYLSQKGADLGRRMENAFREAFFMGYDRVVLVGSDIPGLSSGVLRAGLDALKPGSACIGPANDGGYYLIGFHRHGFAPEIFHNMQWSQEEVCQRTINRFAAIGVDYIRLESLDDVDTINDLEQMVALGTVGPLKGSVLEAARKLIGTLHETI